MIRRLRNFAANLLWRLFVRSAYLWAERHMDQWEMVKFETPRHGIVYLSLTKGVGHPENFSLVDRNGVPVRTTPAVILSLD